LLIWRWGRGLRFLRLANAALHINLAMVLIGIGFAPGADGGLLYLRA